MDDGSKTAYANPALVISLHDVSPAHEQQVRTLLSALEEYGPLSLLLRPNYRSCWPLTEHPHFTAWLRDLSAVGVSTSGNAAGPGSDSPPQATRAMQAAASVRTRTSRRMARAVR